jgi:FkbM family methyltransferase
MAIDRKQFLRNTGCAAGGAVLGALGRGLFDRDTTADGRPSPAPSAPAAASVAVPSPRSPGPEEEHGEESFSQAGEDLIVRFFFYYRKISNITYLDVGANEPVQLNNTYYFYRRGFRGVLVEPNRTLCQRLREKRPGDTVLEAGIGVTPVKEADYYIMSHHSWNTFSKEEADHQAKVSRGKVSVKEVIKMPLLNINDVMERHFQGAPTFLSVDTEGLDLAILKSLDYSRFRPKVICAETLVSSTTNTRPEIAEFMATRGYVVRGGSFVNTIFVDSKIL